MDRPLLPGRTPGLGVGGGIRTARRVAVSAAVLAAAAAAVLVVAVLSAANAPGRAALAQLTRPSSFAAAAAEQRDHTRWWEHGPALLAGASALTAGSDPHAPVRPDPASLPPSMREAIDDSVDPCTDFYAYACGSWDQKASIPDDRTSWLRSWDIPSERIEQQMKVAIEEDTGVVGTFYKSCMDEAAINELGNKPLQPMLAKVDEVNDMKSLTETLVWMGNHDNGALFGWNVSPDSEHPQRRAFYLSPGGMTLPDQSYYLSNADDMKEHRATEKTVIEKLLINAGVPAEQARKDALNCLAIETRTAEIVMPREDARSAVGKRIMRAELKQTVPLFHWDGFFEGIGMPDVGLEGIPFLRAVCSFSILLLLSSSPSCPAPPCFGSLALSVCSCLPRVCPCAIARKHLYVYYRGAAADHARRRLFRQV